MGKKEKIKLVKKLFKSIDIWKKINNDKIVIYRCFQVLPSKKYCVQSADYYYNPIDEKQITYFKNQHLELFFDTLPNKRNKEYDTIEKAIEAFDNYFGNK